MITTLKTKTGFKAMALAVAFSFLWQQILWAGDLAATTLENLNKEQSQTFAPDYLQNQQTSNQSVIAQKQDVEDIINSQNQTANNISDATEESSDTSIELQGPKSASSGQAGAIAPSTIIEEAANTPKGDGAILSVTTQDGDIVHYADGAISSIEKKDGTILRDLVIGGNGELVAVNITYKDGTNEIVAEGKVTRITKPDGTVFRYNSDEKISSILYPDGKTVSFSYDTVDTDGDTVTVLTDSERTSYYDKYNRLKRVEFATKKTIEYDSGVIFKITNPDNSVFTFNIEDNAEGAVSSTLARYTAANGTTYKYIIDEKHSISSVTVEKGGYIAIYNKEGALVSVDGQVITDELIAQAQKDYDTALGIYEDSKGLREGYETSLDIASTDLTTKTTVKDNAYTDLDMATRALAAAQRAREIRQAEYDTLYGQYTASEVNYAAADTALCIAASIEEAAGKDLETVRDVLSEKEAILNDRITASQAVQTIITNLNTAILSGQESLAGAQSELKQALMDEDAARADRDNAKADFDITQAAYDNAKQDRINKEGIFDAANEDLTIKAAAKDKACIELNDAIDVLYRAQEAKDIKQTEYNTLYSQYAVSEDSYAVADRALYTAKSIEKTVLDALNASIAIRDDKKTTYGDKITARQALEDVVAGLLSKIEAYQEKLYSANESLSAAKDEESSAKKEYDDEEQCLIAKQLEYGVLTEQRTYKESVLSAAGQDLADKIKARDLACQELQSAIEGLNNATALKGTKSAEYNTANIDCLNAEAAYSTANTGLSRSRYLETQAYQILTNAIEVNNSNKAVMDLKVSARQSIEITVSNLSAHIQAHEAELDDINTRLTQAIDEQRSTIDDYTEAGKDADAAQIAYNGSAIDERSRTLVFNTVRSDFVNKNMRKIRAYDKLLAVSNDPKSTQALKNARQAEYDITYNDYLKAKTVYDNAYMAMNDAKAFEAKARQALMSAIMFKNNKKTILYYKISARRTLEASAVNSICHIRIHRQELAIVDYNLSRAGKEESVAVNKYLASKKYADAKQADYDSLKQDRINRETAFNSASQDLISKANIKDQAYKDYCSAVQNFNDAQIFSNSKESIYAAADMNCVEAQKTFDAAKAALDSVESLEPKADQALKNLIAARDAKKNIYDDKVRARKDIESEIDNLSPQIQACKTELAEANERLLEAKSEEISAKDEYDKAEENAGVKKSDYGNAKEDIIGKERVFNTAKEDLITKTAAKDKACAELGDIIRALTDAQKAKDTKQAEYDTLYDQYMTSKTKGDAADKALNTAKSLEKTTGQNLEIAQSVLTEKEGILNNKITAGQAIQVIIASLNTAVGSSQENLTKTQNDLKQALTDESTARADHDNAKAVFDTKQTVYSNVTQDRADKESVFNAAKEDLKIKTDAKDKAYTELGDAVCALSDAQAVKDTKQTEYDKVYLSYMDAKSSYDLILAKFNKAKEDEAAAKAQADSLLEALSRLKDICRTFPQEDTVLTSANNEIGIIDINYDAKRQVQQVNRMDGISQSYMDGRIAINGPESTLYSYDPNTLGNIEELTVDRDGIKRIYDKYGNIKSLSLDDATKIVYENGKVKEIQKSDGTTLKNMTFRDSGELDSALVSYPDGSLALYDDAKLLQAISASGDVTDYKDGKIRKVTLEDGTVYDWSYDGDNIIIQDNAKGEKRTYFEGKLIALEELTGSKLTTRYYYDGASGDLSRSEICRNNEILYTYTYAYEGGLTLVRDEDGNTQAYTKDKKLSYIIDSKGRKYSYTYVGKNEGYVDVYFPSGNRAKYDLSGNIIEITKSDGTVIKNITFYDDSTPRNFTYIKDGATYKVEEGKIEEVLSKDGVKTVYYDNGFVKSIGTETADLTEYQYFVKDSKVFNNSSALSNSGFSQLSLYNSNSATYIALSRDSLQFGTGSDGAKHVTADEMLKAGTYNFESLTIDSGKTLTIAPGAIIKALGTITVNGAVFCGGSLDIYAHDFNISASGSVTGAVNIKCNTINNAGIITGNASITGALSNGANELDRDDSFSGLAHYLDYNPGVGSLSPHITFPSCTISSVKWRTGGAGSGNSQGYGILYLYIDGVKTQVSPTYYWGRCPGSFDTGVATINGSWNNVTGIEYYIETDSTIGVARVYGYEMQAIIGQPTIEYINGNPGAANTTPSRPTASIKQPDNPSSGSFESDVIELNALELGSISWSEALPEGTNITFQTRTGDTLAPDSTWSAWSAELTSPASSQITSPKGKYIQYRANLYTTNSSVTPLLKVGENSPITFGYSRAPAGSSELSGIYYATVSKDGVTAACDKNSLPSLVFDPDYMDAVTSEIPGYLLNGTQKELYLKDSVIISELTAIKSIDGTTTEYCQGQISKITRSDGTVIKSASFDADNNAKDFTYSKDGATYMVKDGKIDTVVTAADESIKYYSYGLIESAETGSSKKEYEYGIQTGENYTTKSIFQNGSFSSASILGQNSTTYLQLSKDPLRFGTGLDGAKHVTANETLEAGTYNFESLTIDAGKALIVAPGAIIKVLDTVTVNGAIFCGGTLDIYTPSFNVSSSGSVTGAVNIKCNTINNIGIITGNACMTGSGGTGVTTDDNFSTGMSGSHGAGGSAVVTFPSCNISKARYRASLGSYGLPAYANVYLCVNGSWTCIASYAGAGDSGVADNTTGWSNVTGMMITGQSQNGNCVCSSYSLNEMQAIIGQSTIEYISGSPGTVNTTPSRPTVSIKATDNPSSGSFESGVIELNALDLGSISWNQELPEGTDITFQTRTGDTATPDSTWSEWSQNLTDPKGSGITSAGKKYFQYKINLSTADPSVTPKVFLDTTHGISISYIKISDNPLDPYVKVKESSLRANEDPSLRGREAAEAISSVYNKSGILIWTEDAAGIKTHYDPANPEGTMDLALLKFDPSYANSLARDLPSSKLSDAQKVITVYDQGNDTPVEMINADQSITYFDQGFATKVVDKNGVVQVLYTYDKDKNVTKVEFVEARRQLEENFQKAQASIVTKKEDALAKLVKAESDAEADIDSKSADIQKQIDSERSRLTQEKSKYDPNVYDLSEFSRAFTELDSYEARLKQQKQDAYADIARQVSDAKAKVESDASTAQQDLINNDYNKILCDIVQKESSPLLYQYYRKVLGRDPGEDELLYWMNKVKAEITPNVKSDIKPITPEEVTQYIRNLSEYEERTSRKENIISALTDFFTQYLSASDADKEAILLSLGLTLDDVTPSLRGAEGTEAISGIISWLTGQPLHFGDSAVETIIAMLKDNGIIRSFEDIDKNLLKIDILTGVITKDTEGDLVISMYAMRKTAALNGLILYSEKINYDDLKDKVVRANVICHIDGKHFVLVTAIDDTNGTVTYIDTTVGRSGQQMTVTRLEFMGSWKGYAQSKELTPDSDKRINVTVEKNIRGSGWWKDFWRGVVDIINMVLPVVAVVLILTGNPLGFALLGVNVMIQTIAAVVSIGTWMNVVWSVAAVEGAAIFGGVTSALSKAVSSVTNFVSPGLYNAFTSAANLFKPFATAVGNIATFGTASSSAIAASVGFYVIAQAVSIGTNYLFRGLHLDPTLADIGSALISGAITGLGNPSLGVVGGILQSGVIAGVDQIGIALKLDPNITSLAGMMIGSIVGGSVYTGAKEISYLDLMKNIAPYIYSECAYIGVTKIGELLGIDSRLSYLAGVGIRSSISIGFGSDGIFDWKDAWGGVQQGLLQGITNIGLNFATQELGLNPLMANISFSAISGAINAGIQTALGETDPVTGKKIDYFKAIYNTYTKNALTFLGYADPKSPGYAWQQTAYMSQIQDFTKIVMEKGLVEALNTYGTGFFNAVAVNNIVQSGYTLGGYFAEKLNAGQYGARTLQDGTQVKEVAVKDGQGNTIANVFFQEKQVGESRYWDLIGGEEFTGDNPCLCWGDFGVDAYGKLGYTDAKLYSIFSSDMQFQRIENGYQMYAEICDNNGNVVLVVEPRQDGSYNYYNSYGDYVDAVIKECKVGYSVSLDSGAIFSQSYRSSLFEGEDEGLSWFESQGITKDMLLSIRDDVNIETDGKVTHNLYWQADNSQTIPTNFIEALKTPGAKERIGNYLEGFEYRTNAEITQHFDNNSMLLKTACNNGTVISVRDRGFLADTIKIITEGPINHTAIMYIDNYGEKYIIQEKGPAWWNGLEKYKLDDWLTMYKSKGADIDIGFLSTDPQVAIDLKNSIERNLFYWNRDANGNWAVTDELINMPYDTTGVIGIHLAGTICSGLAVQIYRDGGHPIFTPDTIPQDDQLQYSPNDVYKRLKLIGYVD